MATYFPPLFCGINSILKLTKDLTIEYENGETVIYLKGEECIVVDIIGYGFNIQRLSGGQVFRLMNSSMNEYFEITNNVAVDNSFETSHYEGQQGKLVHLIKDYILKDVISISKGVQFINFVDKTDKGIFHDLLTIEKREKVLRMKDVEFIEYFL